LPPSFVGLLPTGRRAASGFAAFISKAKVFGCKRAFTFAIKNKKFPSSKKYSYETNFVFLKINYG